MERKGKREVVIEKRGSLKTGFTKLIIINVTVL